MVPELGGRGGHWPPQYLADQLTLFKPGVGRLCPPLPLAPPQSFLPSGITVIDSKYPEIVKYSKGNEARIQNIVLRKIFKNT